MLALLNPTRNSTLSHFCRLYGGVTTGLAAQGAVCTSKPSCLMTWRHSTYASWPAAQAINKRDYAFVKDVTEFSAACHARALSQCVCPTTHVTCPIFCSGMLQNVLRVQQAHVCSRSYTCRHCCGQFVKGLTFECSLVKSLLSFSKRLFAHHMAQPITPLVVYPQHRKRL
jgi:hypothetical protein